MMAQKNQKDAIRTVHHLPKTMVDFELLWRYISKFGIDPKEVYERYHTKIGIIL